MVRTYVMHRRLNQNRRSERYSERGAEAPRAFEKGAPRNDLILLSHPYELEKGEKRPPSFSPSNPPFLSIRLPPTHAWFDMRPMTLYLCIVSRFHGILRLISNREDQRRRAPSMSKMTGRPQFLRSPLLGRPTSKQNLQHKRTPTSKSKRRVTSFPQ